MVQGDFAVFVGSEAVGFSCRDSGLVVEPLGSAQREAPAGLEPVEQLGFVLTKRASEPLHRVQLRAHRARRPLAEESLRCPRGVVLPEVLEVLLEKKCAYRAQVAPEQLAKSPPLLVGRSEEHTSELQSREN